MTKLVVTRTVKWKTTVSEDNYPEMTLAEAIAYEKGLELYEVAETIGDDDDAELTVEVKVVD